MGKKDHTEVGIEEIGRKHVDRIYLAGNVGNLQ
jgi:hypothetical protein